jgi:uncharacterized protein YlxW (UPF0749 family)
MKLRMVLILLVSLVLMSTSRLTAQQEPDAAQTAEDLRARLRDVQAQESELQLHVQQLDWDLKPENIERYFAAVGTTRPEELREQRRRQLQSEKDRADAQLNQLATSRARLEAAISSADAEAYQQSAQGSAALQVNPARAGQFPTTLVLVGVLGFIAVGGVLMRIAALRRR